MLCQGIPIFPRSLQARFETWGLLSLQAICHLFAAFHLPTETDFPSIQNESRPAVLVMAGNRYLNQC
jgi:hypothetical protein